MVLFTGLLKIIIKAGIHNTEAEDMETVKHLEVDPVPTVNLRNVRYNAALLHQCIFEVIILEANLHRFLIMGDRLPMITSFRQFMKETQPFCFKT